MRIPATFVSLSLIASIFIGAVPDVAEAVGESWPSANESDGCSGLAAATPLATKIGFLSNSEAIRGPYGDMFGRSVSDVKSDLVTFQLPLGGPAISVHERALPAFKLAAANLVAGAAANPSTPYTIRTGDTFGYAARTVSGSYGMSRHTFGTTVDMNTTTNPFQAGPFEDGDPFRSDMPAWFVGAWTDAGFCWGGDWKVFKDPMHYSWQGPGFTPGYGDPAASYPVTSAATDFTKPAGFDESTFFAGKSGVHLIGDVSGDGAPDPVRLYDKGDNVIVQYVSTRTEYSECNGFSGTIASASVATHEPIVGDFAGYRRSEVGLVDESGPTVSIELISQRGEPGDTIVIDTAVPVRPDQTYVVGDHNWDNSPDLYVVVNHGSSTDVEIWNGADGYATMLAAFVGLFGDTTGWQFSVGDRDLDDLPDLYAFEPQAGGATVHIYTNTGEMLVVPSSVDMGGSLTVADFDGDGRDDLWMNTEGSSFAAWMGSTAIPSTSWFRNPIWECPDEWEPFDWEGTFRDDDGSVFQNDIEWLFAEGITFGCNPPANDMFCPDRSVTRGQMAAFLSRALELPAAESAGFTDTSESVFVADIDRLAAAGITRGCNEAGTAFCPDNPVSREQMAAFLVRGLGYVEQADDPFTDDDGSQFETDIEKLAAAGVTVGCNPPTNTLFCPKNSVTRGQMAAFLHRAIG